MVGLSTLLCLASLVGFVSLFGDNIRKLFGAQAAGALAGDSLVEEVLPTPPPIKRLGSYASTRRRYVPHRLAGTDLVLEDER